jgi:hypothetical protein
MNTTTTVFPTVMEINGDAYDAKLEASCIMAEDYSRDHLNYETFGSDAEEVDAW